MHRIHTSTAAFFLYHGDHLFQETGKAKKWKRRRRGRRCNFIHFMLIVYGKNCQKRNETFSIITIWFHLVQKK